MHLRFVRKAGDQGVERGVGLHLGGIDVELLAPDQASFLTQIDHLLEKALEEVNAKALPNPGQARMVR
jgi:hypothetical protein